MLHLKFDTISTGIYISDI